MTILDELIINSYLCNNGDLTVKKHLHVNTGINKGTIKGDNLTLTVDGQMTNEGKVVLHHLKGKGSFQNHHELIFTEKFSDIDINELINQTNRKDRVNVMVPHVQFGTN